MWCLVALVLLVCNPAWVSSHGRLIEPPSRASAWRYGFDTPHNYNDHELYCGGFSRQWQKNGGKCGICGDAWDAKTPRPHDFGGTYGQGVIVRRYNTAQTINVRVELTASHFGYFEFGVCTNYRTPTQECIAKHLLKLRKAQENVEHLGVRYFPKDGNKVYEMKYKLPNISCAHCLLQWRYVAGNNWGNCPNGTGAIGCGPQEEFRACADIAIGDKHIDDNEIPDDDLDDQEEETTKPSQSYSPQTSIFISIVSFLVICLVLFLIYLHYYRIGSKLKEWIRTHPLTMSFAGQKKDKQSVSNNASTVAPMPPPRARKSSTNNNKQGMFEINLSQDV